MPATALTLTLNNGIEMPALGLGVFQTPLRSLERKALIEREVDTADTRARRVRVTKGGARLAPRAIAVVEQVDSEFFADVPGPQALRFLRRLVQRPDAGAATADRRTVGGAGPSHRRQS
jgi:hypothetical protein